VVRAEKVVEVKDIVAPVIEAPGLKKRQGRAAYMREYMRRRRGVVEGRDRCAACGHLLPKKGSSDG
jgi:hypothetical protein